jgi:hypothetical protein
VLEAVSVEVVVRSIILLAGMVKVMKEDLGGEVGGEVEAL